MRLRTSFPLPASSSLLCTHPICVHHTYTHYLPSALSPPRVYTRLPFLSFSPPPHEIVRALSPPLPSLSRYLAYISIFRVLSFSVACMHPSLAVSLALTRSITLRYSAAAVSNVPSLFLSLFFVHASSLFLSHVYKYIYIYFSPFLYLVLSFSFLLPTLGYLYLNALRLLSSRTLISSLSELHSPLFVSPFRRNLLCPSCSCLLFLPLRSPHYSLPPHAYTCATRTPGELHARTHTCAS